jgi:tetratricopeptide (TPR) repeat protein
MTLNALGGALAFLCRHEEAVPKFREAVDLVEGEDEDACDRFTMNLAYSLEKLQALSEARQNYERAVAGIRQRRNPAITANALNMFAEHWIRQRDFENAEHLAQEALENATKAGDEYLIGVSLNNLAIVAQLRNQHAAAFERFQEVERIYSRLGNDDGVATAKANSASVLYALGRAEQAQELYTTALAIYERLDRKESKAATLMSLGNRAREQGECSAALNWYTKALELFREMKDVVGEGTALYRMAMVEAGRGSVEEALLLDEQALQLVGGRELPWEGEILEHIGLMFFRNNSVERALETWQKSCEVAGKKWPSIRARSTQHIALCLFLMDRNIESAAHWNEAAELWSTLHKDEQYAQCLQGRATALLEETLKCLAASIHNRLDEAQRQEAPSQMIALCGVLTGLYKQLGVANLAGDRFVETGAACEFLGQTRSAADCYERAALEYAGASREKETLEARREHERLLKQLEAGMPSSTRPY